MQLYFICELFLLSDDYNNDDDFHENNYLVEDDFQLVTRKKKGIKNFQNAHRRGSLFFCFNFFI